MPFRNVINCDLFIELQKHAIVHISYDPNITVWKFHDFSVTQILREINFGASRNFKTGVFAILEALNFVNLVTFSMPKTAKIHKNQNSEASKCVKIAYFALLEPPKLISHKI